MDDLDDDMELPDDELAGESAMGDLGDEAVITDVDAELDIIIVEPAGRPSGGARSASPATPRKAAKRPAPKLAKAPAKAPVKKAAKRKPAAKKKPVAKKKPAKKQPARKKAVAKKAKKKVGQKKR